MSETTNDPDDMEALAALEHESWSGWTRYMLKLLQRELLRELLETAGDDQLKRVEIYNLLNDRPCIRRWRRQLNTRYDYLPEKEKGSDRVEARKKLKVYRGDA